jgi:hypothetical protein
LECRKEKYFGGLFLMVDIPKEYTDADFGFSAIDEATYKAQQQSVDTSEITDEIKEVIGRLDKKLDSLLLKKAVEEDEEVDRVKAMVTENVQSKLTQAEKLIMPLLVNLLKTSDKEYIHWPNREKSVKSTIDRLLALTRG